jgi:hypothetical protein
MDKGAAMTEPTIIKSYANRFCGTPVVEVEPFRIVTHSNRTLEITEFYQDGCVIVAKGWHVRKNGEYAKGPKQSACIGAPDNVRAALKEIREGKQ